MCYNFKKKVAFVRQYPAMAVREMNFARVTGFSKE